jgi:phage shock protein C
MTAQATTFENRFTRNADKACLGGVCAGLADYFGFNLRVTRLLVIIAFFVATPLTVLLYIAIVLLVPAVSNGPRYGKEGRNRRRAACRRRCRMSRRQKRQAAEEAELAHEEGKRELADKISQRCRSLDERLANIEKYVTSARYDLDREFRNL